MYADEIKCIVYQNDGIIVHVRIIMVVRLDTHLYPTIIRINYRWCLSFKDNNLALSPVYRL